MEIQNLMDNNEIIRTKNLTIDFMGFIAVNKVNLIVKKSEIVGIIGPNGAGKTTLLHLLSGYYKPVSGRIFLKNKDITNLTPEKRISLGIARTFQLVSTFSNLTVLENLTMSYYWKMNTNNLFLKAFFDRTNLVSNQYEQIKNYLELFRFTNIADKLVKNIPMGSKRELEIAMALINEPEVLFLDEPFSGLGDAEIDKLLIILKRFAKGKTVIVIEHKISKIKDFTKRIVVMNEGKIIADGNFDEVLQDPEVRKAYWKVK